MDNNRVHTSDDYRKALSDATAIYILSQVEAGKPLSQSATNVMLDLGIFLGAVIGLSVKPDKVRECLELVFNEAARVTMQARDAMDEIEAGWYAEDIINKVRKDPDNGR